MDAPHVYDKSEYHFDSVAQFELPDEHAANHTVVFLRWLIERELMSAFFAEEGAEILERYRAGSVGIHAVYEWWDCALVDDMLSDAGNAFARSYFNEFDGGRYQSDYRGTLQRDLPTEFHIPYTEANYQAMRAVIDRRYAEWKKPEQRRRWWWPF